MKQSRSNYICSDVTAEEGYNGGVSMRSILRLLMSNTFISVQKKRINKEASKIWFMTFSGRLAQELQKCHM